MRGWTRRIGAATPGLLAGLAALLLAGAAAAVSVGVAPFERVAAEGHGVPDVATRLAQRLATSGVEKVVGPEELGAPALAEPAAHEVSEWASAAGVGYVVVGRTTRLGNTLSVDARVLEAAGGAALGARLVEEATRPEDLGRAVDALAGQIVERIAEAGGAAQPPAGTAPVAAARGEDSASRPNRRQGPISIKADELEAVTSGAEKKFLFRGSVRAVQDDLVLRSDHLEAFYPPGSSQPERLVATGHVVMEQEGRVAHCEKAIYFRSDQRVECTGNAELEQQCDRVRGEMITFYLDKELLKVTGAADVKLRPDEPGCGTATAASAGESP